MTHAQYQQMAHGLEVLGGDLKIHVDGQGRAVAKLSWSSSSQATQIIPKSRVFPMF